MWIIWLLLKKASRDTYREGEFLLTLYRCFVVSINALGFVVPSSHVHSFKKLTLLIALHAKMGGFLAQWFPVQPAIRDSIWQGHPLHQCHKKKKIMFFFIIEINFLDYKGKILYFCRGYMTQIGFLIEIIAWSLLSFLGIPIGWLVELLRFGS